jgi:FtsP/CotA-like multicopper oxidase with cupredoxin domain
MLTRRRMLRLGLVGAGYALLPSDHRYSPAGTAFADDTPPVSPRTTTFSSPLPIPDRARPLTTSLYDAAHPAPGDYARFVTGTTRFFRIVAEERYVQFDPLLPPTAVWGYRDGSPDAPDPWPFALGPILTSRFGFTGADGGMIVRHVNGLPADHQGFGVPFTAVHLHGGHHLARADGFGTNLDGLPAFVTAPGGHFDHCHPMLDPGFDDFDSGRSPVPADVTERPAFLWYHDHLLDFTGANVYRGLAGVAPIFDALDSDDETDPDGLRLPSGECDVPLVFQDKRFNRDGSLFFDPFDHDGQIGDKFLVNGAVQPFLDVRRRKYRFRFLNASSARIYQLFLTNANGASFPMTQIATEGGLLSQPIAGVQSVLLGMAERVEVVIDFAALPATQGTFYIENRMAQTEGRKPDGVTSRGTRLLQFNVLAGKLDDPSRVGIPEGGQTFLRRFDPVPQRLIDAAVTRTFTLDRDSGAWTINGRLAGDLDRPIARPKQGQPEIWRLVNGSGGWWHPVHIHLEFGRVLRRNGRTPPLSERDGMAKKDTFLLRGGESVDVFLQFRDYPGPYVFHCHNLQHEDMAMMARFDVVPA